MPDPSPALPPRVRALLEGTNAATLATLDADGAPRPTVVWYRLEADGRILVNSRAPRRWSANLLRDPRIAISVIDAANALRWAGLTGVVDEVVDDVARAREDIVALAHRYHPEGPSAASLAEFRNQERVTFLVRVTGVHDHTEG